MRGGRRGEQEQTDASGEAQIPPGRHSSSVSTTEDLDRQLSMGEGSALLRPNRGLTNSSSDALFGLAIHELTGKIRLANILAATAAILTTMASLILRLATLKLYKLVLSCSLAGLSAMLLLVEVLQVWNISSRANHFLHENFGYLYNPLPKAVYIVFLSTLSLCLGDLSEFIIAAVYFCSAVVQILLWCQNAEYRNMYQDDTNDDGAEPSVITPKQQAPISWSNYSLEETSSLSATANSSW